MPKARITISEEGKETRVEIWDVKQKDGEFNLINRTAFTPTGREKIMVEIIDEQNEVAQ